MDIQAERTIFNKSIELYFFNNVKELDIVEVAEPLTFKEHDNARIMAEPTITLSMTEAQKLMDELWHAGLRPTEGTGSAGALAAVQKHLEDMRKIAFKGLDI